MSRILILALGAILALSSCSDDDSDSADQLKITITNVFAEKANFQTGSFDAIAPGDSRSVSFHAGKGHYLQFATMFVQSNDLFLGPDDTGLRLYNDDGVALTGDVTDMISLWDAGTEVNEEPGTGPNQALRQTGPNTGATENGNVVLIEDVNDGYSYPSVAELSEITLSHDGGTLFTLTITNNSASSSIATPFAPGVWVVHSMGQFPMFQEGSPSSMGLEALAEDGNNAILGSEYEGNTGLSSPFAPGAYNVGTMNEIFTRNGASTPAIEALAEDGDPSNYDNIYNTPDGASDAGPILPSQSYSFTFTAEESDLLSLALMLVQSNDWFIGLNDFALFDSDGNLNSGDITSSAALYESGTEVDEYPGAGNNQAPRQSGPNTGVEETKDVARVSNPDDNVPAVNEMIRITLERS